jgi:catechol 2,3-dioxygenase-like lactoylglutathione lyase family enzyme
VNAGTSEIYFTHSPDFVKLIADHALHPDIFIWVTDADQSFNFHVKNGAEVIETITDRPWGARQYVVRDPNGYNLKFAQPLWGYEDQMAQSITKRVNSNYHFLPTTSY